MGHSQGHKIDELLQVDGTKNILMCVFLSLQTSVIPSRHSGMLRRIQGRFLFSLSSVNLRNLKIAFHASMQLTYPQRSN